MTCDFTSFTIVFQSYQDDGRLIMKGCAGTLFTEEKISPQAGIELAPIDPVRDTLSNDTSSTTTLRRKFLSNYQFVEK